MVGLFFDFGVKSVVEPNLPLSWKARRRRAQGCEQASDRGLWRSHNLGTVIVLCKHYARLPAPAHPASEDGTVKTFAIRQLRKNAADAGLTGGGAKRGVTHVSRVRRYDSEMKLLLCLI